jgi:hypothetical protein
MMLQPIPGAPGVLAVELAGLDGRLALVRDPRQDHSLLQLHADGRTAAIRLDDDTLRLIGRDPGQARALLLVHAEGRTVVLQLDDTALRVLRLASREAAGPG